MTTELDYAYAAGIIDGEGHVKVQPRKTRSGRSTEVPCITVAMTHEGTISWLKATFGAGSICQPASHAEHHKPIWKWDVTNRKAYAVAKLVRPYAITKAAELDDILRHYEQPETRKFERTDQRGHLNGNAKLTPADVCTILELKGTESQRVTGARFGVNQTVISRIQRGAGYRNIAAS